MKTLTPYLAFGGTCEEALNFYKDCFGCDSLEVRTFRDSPSNVPENYKDKVMHAEFRSGDLFFMASDTPPSNQVKTGNTITLSINLNDENEQTGIWDKLSQGAQILMPLNNTFWGARFGMLIDQYGINWMLNCQPEKAHG